MATNAELCAAMISYTERCMIAIGAVYKSGNIHRPHDIMTRGTGSLVSVDGCLYLLSARHVLERQDEEDEFFCLIYTTGYENPQIIELDRVILHDKLDVAAFPVAGSDINFDSKAALGLCRFDQNGVDMADDPLFVHGFPKEADEPEKDGITFVAQGYLTGQGEVTDYVVENDLLSIDYSKLGQHDLHGSLFMPFNPKGKSGSLVWKTNINQAISTWNPNDSLVVGLVTDYSEPLHRLNAIRAPAIAAFLSNINNS